MFGAGKSCKEQVEHFAILDFASQILRAAESSNEELKFALREQMKVRVTA